MTQNAKMKTQAPEPIVMARDALFELDAFVKLAWEGLKCGEQAIRAVKLFRRVDIRWGEQSRYTDDRSYAKILEGSKKSKKFATNQAKQGFPYLYETATIRLWTILETAADDLVLTLLENFTKA